MWHHHDMRRTHRITITLSDAESRAVQDAAAKRGMSAPGLVRLVLARIVAGTDLPPRSGRAVAAAASADRAAHGARAKSEKPEGSTR
jgi:hypothetical protein